MEDSLAEKSISNDFKAWESEVGENGRPDTLDVNFEIAAELGSELKNAEFEESRSGSRTQPSSSLEDLSLQTAEFESLDDDELQRSRKKSRNLAVSLKSKLRELSPSRRSPKVESPKTETKNKALGAKSSPKTSTGWLPASFNQIFSSYKSKSTDFRRLFRDLPESEQLIVDYSCALQRDILVHGRLYMSQNWLCFYANIFGWETFVTIKFVHITVITKEKTALVIPNAIQVCTESEKYFFASLVSRDTAYSVLFRIWQNALLDQPLSPLELRNIVGRYEDLQDGSSDNVSDDDDEEDEDEDEEDDDEDDDDGERDSGSSDSSEDGSNEGSNLSEGNSETTKVPTTPGQLPSKGSKTSLATNSSDSSNQKPATPEGPPAVAITPPTPKQGPESLDFCAKNTRKLGLSKKTHPKMKGGDNRTKKDSSEMEEEGSASENQEQSKILSTAPVPCPCEKHWSNHLLKEEYNVNVDTLFEHLFTESDFYKKLQKGRKTKDLKFNPWAETEEGQKRTITYTISLNYPIGPKTSPTTEEQHCLKESVPNKVYIVECEVTNEGIPYGDTFTVCTRYCITRITDTSCKLRVTSKIKFIKSVWGFVKNMIEKNATEGLDGYFKYLGSSLRKLIEPGRRPNRKRKGSHSTRHKRSRSIHDRDRTLSSAASEQPAEGHEEQQSTFFKWMLPRIRVSSFPSFGGNNQKAFTVLITLLLATLLFINLSLIRRLQNLENSAHYRYDWDLKNLPTDSKEWAKLLQQQRHLQQLEMSRWQDILTTSMQLMTQVQRSLEELNAELNRHDTLRKELFVEKPPGEDPTPAA